MSQELLTLNQIFGPIQARVHSIESGSIDYMANVNPTHEVDSLNQKVFPSDYSLAVNHIDITLKIIEELKVALPTILNKVAFKEEKVIGGNWCDMKSADTVKQEVQEKISKELDYYLTALISLRSKLIRLIDAVKDDLTFIDDKIHTNLSVVEIGALFRLLFDAGLLKETNKTKLSVRITKSFVSKKVRENKPGPIFNAMFESTDKSGFEFWNSKLPELQGKLAKIIKAM